MAAANRQPLGGAARRPSHGGMASARGRVRAPRHAASSGSPSIARPYRGRLNRRRLICREAGGRSDVALHELPPVSRRSVQKRPCPSEVHSPLGPLAQASGSHAERHERALGPAIDVRIDGLDARHALGTGDHASASRSCCTRAARAYLRLVTGRSPSRSSTACNRATASGSRVAHRATT